MWSRLNILGLSQYVCLRSRVLATRHQSEIKYSSNSKYENAKKIPAVFLLCLFY